MNPIYYAQADRDMPPPSLIRTGDWVAWWTSPEGIICALLCKESQLTALKQAMANSVNMYTTHGKERFEEIIDHDRRKQTRFMLPGNPSVDNFVFKQATWSTWLDEKNNAK